MMMLEHNKQIFRKLRGVTKIVHPISKLSKSLPSQRALDAVGTGALLEVGSPITNLGGHMSIFLKVLSILTLVASTSVANMSTTIIPGVDKKALEKSLRKEMKVRGIDIVEIKEMKMQNLAEMVSEFLGTSETPQRWYSMAMIVDESAFNQNQHIVRCTILDRAALNQMIVYNCKSTTAHVEAMSIQRSK